MENIKMFDYVADDKLQPCAGFQLFFYDNALEFGVEIMEDKQGEEFYLRIQFKDPDNTSQLINAIQYKDKDINKLVHKQKQVERDMLKTYVSDNWQEQHVRDGILNLKRKLDNEVKELVKTNNHKRMSGEKFSFGANYVYTMIKYDYIDACDLRNKYK